MTCGTACFLHDTRTVLHVMCMWFNPKVPPLFFSCQAAVRRSDILENLAVGGGAVPSGHLTKCAEQARCRAGT